MMLMGTDDFTKYANQQCRLNLRTLLQKNLAEQVLFLVKIS